MYIEVLSGSISSGSTLVNHPMPYLTHLFESNKRCIEHPSVLSVYENSVVYLYYQSQT